MHGLYLLDELPGGDDVVGERPHRVRHLEGLLDPGVQLRHRAGRVVLLQQPDQVASARWHWEAAAEARGRRHGLGGGGRAAAGTSASSRKETMPSRWLMLAKISFFSIISSSICSAMAADGTPVLLAMSSSDSVR